MNLKITLTVTALLSILLSTFHLADDVVIGIEPGGTSNYIGILIVAVYLYATVMLGDRRWAHVIVLIGSIGGAAVPYLHMTGVGLVGGKATNYSGKFFWIWTLLALGATAIVSVVLSAQRLWALQRGHYKVDAATSKQ
jgi:hypothetical protein